MTKHKFILLAGSSESGKSTAGEYLSSLGAIRIKLRPILLHLHSGNFVRRAGALTRENFDWDELIAAIETLSNEHRDVVMVFESFIDPELAKYVKERASAAACYILYIDAPRALRIARQARKDEINYTSSERIVGQKDEYKQVEGNKCRWEKVSTHLIDNSGKLSTFLDSLATVYRSLIER